MVVVFGITIFVGFGGSFFTTGRAFGLIETSDLGSTDPGFFGAGTSGLETGFAALTGLLGFCTGFFATGFFVFWVEFFFIGLAAGLETFFGAGRLAFFLAGLAGRAVFRAGRAGLRTGFLVLVERACFLVAIGYPFFETITFSDTSFTSISVPP
ncbi:MAG TPA: hypothetical protein VEB63_02425 [Chitinophagaceae bacterium]|nr:hypothetical protein [Chitinophagaceae bacterium]